MATTRQNRPRKSAVPATRSSAARLAVRRRAVVILLLAIMTSGVLALFIAVQANNRPIPEPVGVEPRLAAVAEQAGRDFLAGRNSTVPAVEGVDTNFSGEENPAKDEEVTPEQVKQMLHGVSGLTVAAFHVQGETVSLLGENNDVWVHHIRFRVELNAAPFLLTVPVVDDPKLGTLLAGRPALEPASTGIHRSQDVKYTNLYSTATTDISESVLTSVEKWVAAYTAGGTNSDALRTVTGDQNPDRTYTGLGLAKAGELVEVLAVLPAGGGETGKPAGVIVQVQVGLPVPATNGFTLSSTYDLYVVTEDNPAQPPVVAWGPAGSVEQLTPYMNAN